MIASIAVFASLVAFGNITDYGANFESVRHVLAMDTIRPGSTIGSRAITNPALHHLAYAIIIAAEALTAALCWIGALRLLYSLVYELRRGTREREEGGGGAGARV